MNTKKVKSKQISYKQMAEMLLEMHVELILMADTHPENEKNVTATNYTSDSSVLFYFATDNFDLSLDLVRKEVIHG